MREQDRRADGERAEAGALVVEHHPHVVGSSRGVPVRVDGADVREGLEHQHRALVRAPPVLAALAADVRLVGELDHGPHKERSEVDGHEEEVSLGRVERAQR